MGKTLVEVAVRSGVCLALSRPHWYCRSVVELRWHQQHTPFCFEQVDHRSVIRLVTNPGKCDSCGVSWWQTGSILVMISSTMSSSVQVVCARLTAYIAPVLCLLSPSYLQRDRRPTKQILQAYNCRIQKNTSSKPSSCVSLSFCLCSLPLPLWHHCLVSNSCPEASVSPNSRHI